MVFLLSFCFFKQKTAYEMRISDWSSDVCSSDLAQTTPGKPVAEKVSLDTLASLPLMSDLQMSPGGTKIAMTLGAGNEFGYAVLDLSKPGSKPQIFARASTFKEAGQRDVTSYRWVDEIGRAHV